MKVEGNLGFAKLISNTSYYHRKEETGYEGTLYNLGFYQIGGVFEHNRDGSTCRHRRPIPCSTATACICRRERPITVRRTRSTTISRTSPRKSACNQRMPTSPLFWTAGVFFSEDRQTYLEQIHDPLLNELSIAATGLPYPDWFVDPNTGLPVPYDPAISQ